MDQEFTQYEKGAIAVNGETIVPCASAGAQMFVVGTGLFAYPDYRERLAKLREAALLALREKV